MKKIPGFNIITTNGSVTLVFQTVEHKAEMRFENELVSIYIDGELVFQTGKE